MMYKISVKKYLEEHDFEALCPKAVLFDMDGVLYDSMPNHAIAWQESMARFGIQMTADDAYATEGARGVDTIRQMVLRQQRREITEEEAQKMYDVKTQIFHSLPEAPVMPGVLELMEKIKKAGMMCCVVTGSGQRPLIERILKDFQDFVSHHGLRRRLRETQPRTLPDGTPEGGRTKPMGGLCGGKRTARRTFRLCRQDLHRCREHGSPAR